MNLKVIKKDGKILAICSERSDIVSSIKGAEVEDYVLDAYKAPEPVIEYVSIVDDSGESSFARKVIVDVDSQANKSFAIPQLNSFCGVSYQSAEAALKLALSAQSASRT